MCGVLSRFQEAVLYELHSSIVLQMLNRFVTLATQGITEQKRQIFTNIIEA